MNFKYATSNKMSFSTSNNTKKSRLTKSASIEREKILNFRRGKWAKSFPRFFEIFPRTFLHDEIEQKRVNFSFSPFRRNLIQCCNPSWSIRNIHWMFPPTLMSIEIIQMQKLLFFSKRITHCKCRRKLDFNEKSKYFVLTTDGIYWKS